MRAIPSILLTVGLLQHVSGAVDFESEILPILKESCLACHNQTKAKADLVLETPETILKGGESGPAVVAGKPSDSLLWKVASHTEKPFMPPKDNKVNAPDLNSAQLHLLERWIEEGARGEVHGTRPIVWQTLRETVHPILSLAISDDGRFAACGRGNRLIVYDVSEAKEVANLTDPALGSAQSAHLDLVQAVDFAPDGEFLASGSYREVKLWRRVGEIPGRLSNRVARLERAGVRATNYLAYRKSLVDKAEKEHVTQVERVRKASDALGAAQKAYTEQTNQLAAARSEEAGVRKDFGAVDGRLKEARDAAQKVEAELAKTKAEFKNPDELIAAAMKVALATNGAAGVKAEFDKAEQRLKAVEKKIKDLEASTQRGQLTNAAAVNELNFAIAAAKSAADDLVIAQNNVQIAEGDVKQYELQLLAARSALTNSVSAAEGQAQAPAAWKLERTISMVNGQPAFADRVNAVRFSPDGQFLATGGGEPSRSGEVKVWRVRDGQLVHDLKGLHSDAVLALAYSPDGRYLASGGADRFARITEVTSGKIVRILEGHTHHVLGVSWKADGHTVVTAGADNQVKLWDAFSGEKRKGPDAFSKEVTAISYVGEGEQALVAGADSTLKLIKENGETVRNFQGARGYLQAAVAGADGRVILAGGDDGVVRAWRTEDGKLLAELAPQ